MQKRISALKNDKPTQAIGRFIRHQLPSGSNKAFPFI